MRLIINERQAEIVCRIYDWYVVERISILEIIRLLRGTPSPGDEKGRTDKKRGVGEWEETRIYGILSDSAHIRRSLRVWPTQCVTNDSERTSDYR